MADIVHGRLDGQLPLLRAHLTGTVRAAVDAVVDAVEQANATAVDVQALADILREAVNEGVSPAVASARIEQQTPLFRPLEAWMRTNQGLVNMLILLLAVVTLVAQLLQDDHRLDAGPSGDPARVVQLDRSKIERATEDHMRELEIPVCEPPKR